MWFGIAAELPQGLSIRIAGATSDEIRDKVNGLRHQASTLKGKLERCRRRLNRGEGDVCNVIDPFNSNEVISMDEAESRAQVWNSEANRILDEERSRLQARLDSSLRGIEQSLQAIAGHSLAAFLRDDIKTYIQSALPGILAWRSRGRVDPSAIIELAGILDGLEHRIRCDFKDPELLALCRNKERFRELSEETRRELNLLPE